RRELRAPNGDPIELTDSEFDLLTILLRQPKRILSRDEMMQLLRGRDWAPLERTIDGHIARLRKRSNRRAGPRGSSRASAASVMSIPVRLGARNAVSLRAPHGRRGRVARGYRAWPEP